MKTADKTTSLVKKLENWEKEGKEIHRELRFSLVSKAIQQCIEKSPIGGCPVFDKRGGLVHHRGTGAFRMKEVYAFPPGAVGLPYPVVRFFFDVAYWDDDWDEERECCAMIDVPAALVDEFDQVAFDEWIEGRNVLFHEQKLEEAKVELSKLLMEFPELRGSV